MRDFDDPIKSVVNNSTKNDKVELIPEWDGVVRGPDLPKTQTWCRPTQEWWRMWRTSPQAFLFTRSDWYNLEVGAIIHNRIYTSENISHTALVNLSGELRKIQAAVGCTYADRKSMGMKMTKSAPSEEEKEATIEKAATEVVDYFERLKRKVAEGGK